MTDNERKAAIETMAAKLFALEEYPNAPEESHPEDLWGLITEASRILWRKKAEAALESIGYFDIVKAARRLLKALDGEDAVQDIDTGDAECNQGLLMHSFVEDQKARQALEDALKRGGITLARP